MAAPKVPVFFHRGQLEHNPRYEWALGKRLHNMETTKRAETILAAVEASPEVFEVRAPESIPTAWIERTHDARLLTVYREAAKLDAGVVFYPSVFPKRHQTTPDPTDLNQSGYFCFDAGTALTSATWSVAGWSAAAAYEAAELVLSGSTRLAYGLCRPPGHHASGDLFGGYSYLNNAAIAATRLRREGRVAILDIDLHHGNGTQAFFYRDPEVLYVSMHGDPRVQYPYFSGYEKETGAGRGEGFNLNIPLPQGTDFPRYRTALETHALPAVRAFAPGFLVISAGFDTYRKDPIRSFKLDTPDFRALGQILGHLDLPTVVVQEGGYFAAKLGENAATFLTGVRDALY